MAMPFTPNLLNAAHALGDSLVDYQILCKDRGVYKVVVCTISTSLHILVDERHGPGWCTLFFGINMIVHVIQVYVKAFGIIIMIDTKYKRM